MNKISRNRIIKVGVVVLCFVICAYLLPAFFEMPNVDVKLFLNNLEGVDALKKSLLFAFSSTLLNIGVSLFFALVISQISMNSARGKLISYLIVPVMLGNVSVAFIGKLIFSDSAFFQSGMLIKFEALTLLQFWQYGTLYVYLFWLTIQNIPRARINYAQSTKMSASEQLRDIFLPACRNLAALLFILNFILSIYEDAKIQLIFKSSAGTHTELISQWLNRFHQSASLISPTLANEKTIQLCMGILLAAIICAIFSVILFSSGYNRVIKSEFSLRLPKFNFVSKAYPFVLLLFILLPIVYSIGLVIKNFYFEFTHLISPFFFTLITSAFAISISIVLGVFLRLGWKDVFSSFNNRSLFFYILIFTLQLVPPIAIYLTGFQWLKIIAYQNLWSLQLVWVLGHTLLTLPLLISFISVSHFKTSNNELGYMEAHKFSLLQIIRDSFLRRYAAEYLLSFLIAFSLIWNESIVNNLLSDFIPSFVSEMKMNIEGRAADYAKGMNYLFVALAISLAATWLWQYILKKSSTGRNEIA